MMKRFKSFKSFQLNSTRITSIRTLAHSRTVVNDKGGNIFVFGHGDRVVGLFESLDEVNDQRLADAFFWDFG